MYVPLATIFRPHMTIAQTIHRAATAPAKLPEIATNALERLKSSKHYAKTLRLSSDQLKALNLRKGINTVTFSVLSSYSGVAKCTARIFFWETDFQVVVSDIDGTITKCVSAALALYSAFIDPVRADPML